MELDGMMFWVPDVAAAADFYTRAFGFDVELTRESGTYVQMSTGAATLSFADEGAAPTSGADIHPSRPDRPAPPVQLTLVADDVAADYQRALDAGATAVAPLVEKPWGQTVGYVRDPNGFLVEISSPAAW